ncbi:hypothetical protein FKM82_026748 [Ascaphus truei]
MVKGIQKYVHFVNSLSLLPPPIKRNINGQLDWVVTVAILKHMHISLLGRSITQYAGVSPNYTSTRMENICNVDIEADLG